MQCVIYCERCQGERAAHKRQVTRGHGKRLRAVGRWENVCTDCGLAYSAPPPGVRARGATRTRERAGQMRLW